MRFLGIGDELNLGDMYLRLMAEGHEVKVHVSEAEHASTMDGLLPKIADWRAALPWIEAAGRDGIILFETAHDGVLQDELRGKGFNVIGGSAYGDRLELDRGFGQQTLAEIGLRTAPVHEFREIGAAIAFMEANPARYVLKHNGKSLTASRTYIGELDSGADVLALLKRQREIGSPGDKPDFILMDHMQGVEVGVGAYFNGKDFLDAVCLDWEHKRFIEHDLGELTGEMGTVVAYRGAERLFEATLLRMREKLREGRYVGYINLNTIVNEDGIWPLEFTCRFGYPGYSILSALHEEGWGALFARMVDGEDLHFSTRDGFAVGVVLTLPPHPYREGYAELSRGLPVLFREEMAVGDRAYLHFDEVELRGGEIVTSGVEGYLGVATGAGASIEEARKKAYALCEKVVVPNLRYRTDIGQRLIDRDWALLRQWGYVD